MKRGGRLAGGVSSINHIDQKSPDGRTMLHDLVHAGNCKGVEICIALGANIEVTNSSGVTPLMSAARHGFTNILQTLISAGAKVNSRDDDGNTALIWVCCDSRDHVRCMEILIAAKADIAVANAKGITAFNYACARRCINYIRRLITAGVDPNTPIFDLTGCFDRDGRPMELSALLHAARHTEADVIQVLLEFEETDIERSAPDRQTALHISCRSHITNWYYSRAKACAIQLLNAGADVMALDCCGRTPIDIARQRREYCPYGLYELIRSYIT